MTSFDFPCFWPSEPLKWVVVVAAVVAVVVVAVAVVAAAAVVVVGSDVDVNARRPTCRHSKCLSHRCGRGLVHA